MITTHSRGHKIEWNGKGWIYSDTKEVYDDSRPCKKCGEYPTKEGHDACIANLPNVKNACCGHGVEKMYVQSK